MLLAGAIVIIMTISRVAPVAARDDIYLDDAQQHIYWMYRYADPTLFPDDLSIEYFGSPAVVTPGYGVIYAVLAPYVDPQLLSELLAGALMLVCGWLSMLIGARAAPRWPDLGALTAVVTLVALHLMVALTETAALQRSFALPTLMLCVWALMARRMVWLGAAFVVAALFYLVVIPVLGVCSLIVGGVRVARERRLPRRWWAAMLLGVVALGVLGMREVPDDIGPLITLDEARTMPEFQPGGRQQLFIDDPVHYYITSARTGFRMSPLELALIALAVAVVTVSPGPRSLPLEGWALLGSALLCWVLAHGLMFAMYLPNRHVTWAMPLAVIILIAAAVPQWLMRLRSRVDLHRQWLICGGLLAVWLGLGGYWMTATWMSQRAGVA